MSNPHPSNGFKKGQSGNPNGRPKSGESLTDIAKKVLERVDPNHKKTYKALFMEQLIKQAIKNPDGNAAKHLWNHIDGMPVQKTDLTSNGQTMGVMIVKPEKQDD